MQIYIVGKELKHGTTLNTAVYYIITTKQWILQTEHNGILDLIKLTANKRIKVKITPCKTLATLKNATPTAFD